MEDYFSSYPYDSHFNKLRFSIKKITLRKFFSSSNASYHREVGRGVLCFVTIGGAICLVLRDCAEKIAPTLSEPAAGAGESCRKIQNAEETNRATTITSVNPIRYPRFRLMSVRRWPGVCLRLWCSPRYQRISPLHREFLLPLHPSSLAVSNAAPPLSSGI